MTPLRFAIVGLGNIGATHLATLNSERVPGAAVSAVVTAGEADLPASVRRLSTLDELLAGDYADVVVIATPTMAHADAGRAVLDAGCHLLMEKPLALSLQDAEGLVNAVPSGVCAAVMLNQRYHPAYARIRHIVSSGGLGALIRYSWTMTGWYRPDVYFAVSAWRGTWRGEGGGALLNQCIHNLDALQWIVGLPDSVQAQISFGRFHDIEVEDEVSALLQHDTGVTGTLVASTGEAPGINQLDIVGDRGTLQYDGEVLQVHSASGSVAEHCASTRDMFGMPAFTTQEETLTAVGAEHAQVFNNLVAAVATGSALDTPLAAGLNSLALANALLLSAWEERRVALPLDAARYQRALAQRIATSELRTPADLTVNINMDQSYR